MSIDQSYMSSIQLPDTSIIFRNIKNAKCLALDIGGSLTKIAYYSTVSYRKVAFPPDRIADLKENLELHCFETSEIERLHFVKFETKYIEQCLEFIGTHLVHSKESLKGRSIKVTGGGAYKYADLIWNKLGLKVEKEDEICCLIKGCNFLLRNIPDEQFLYCRHEDPEYRFVNVEPEIFPYLLVNIGSGVSIMKVEGEGKYERIGGTSMGGGTFWGLGSLLTKAKGFDDLLLLASSGDHRKVDLLVKDIYGGNYNNHGLSGDVIASSFGKAMVTSESNRQFTEADIARSLLFTVSNEIGQLASLYAMLHNLKKVYFGGYFLRNHPVSMHTISFSIKFWSKGVVQGLFLRHEGYLGAIGAFLKGAEECDTEKTSWGENYAGSSGFVSPVRLSTISPWASADQLEMDKSDHPLTLLPLLAHPHQYSPDTVDLILDRKAREYWLSCFENSLDGVVARAIQSQLESKDAKERAEKFRTKYLNRLYTLSNHPFAYGSLTVRSLLDMREHCLNEFDFPDLYLKQKKLENDEALTHLSDLLEYLDSLPWAERQEALMRGLLAGNVFDWGAKEAASLMSRGLHFNEASDRLQKRPWLRDDLDLWIERLKGRRHQCALVFLDNSGCDVVLGVIPFVRELLMRGTKVILCANTKPALNDVTALELEVLVRQLTSKCPIIRRCFEEATLRVRQSGQGSPCLDLSRLPLSLVEEVVEFGCDLVVIEGMGRALHTNLNVELTCDVLKLAVIKNKWLAERLGGEMFAVMCKFEPRKSSTSPSPERVVGET